MMHIQGFTNYFNFRGPVDAPIIKVGVQLSFSWVQMNIKFLKHFILKKISFQFLVFHQRNMNHLLLLI